MLIGGLALSGATLDRTWWRHWTPRLQNMPPPLQHKSLHQRLLNLHKQQRNLILKILQNYTVLIT